MCKSQLDQKLQHKSQFFWQLCLSILEEKNWKFKFQKWPFFDHLWSFFWQLHFSQNWDSDGHFRRVLLVCHKNNSDDRPVLLLGHISLWPFNISYGSLICPFLVQVYKVVRVRVVVVVVDKCHLEDVLKVPIL